MLFALTALTATQETHAGDRDDLIAEVQGHIAAFAGRSQGAVDRWQTVLDRLNDNGGISDTDLQSWLDDANANGWGRGRDTLPKVIAYLANPPQAIAAIEHLERWTRVLAALGVDNGAAPMTSAEAQGLADQGLANWDRVAETLAVLEALQAYQSAQQNTQQNPQQLGTQGDGNTLGTVVAQDQIYSVGTAQLGANGEIPLHGVRGGIVLRPVFEDRFYGLSGVAPIGYRNSAALALSADGTLGVTITPPPKRPT